MASDVVTRKDVEDWFSDLEDTLKNQIMHTELNASEERDSLYSLYQASQLLKARFYQDVAYEFEVSSSGYDNERYTRNDN